MTSPKATIADGTVQLPKGLAVFRRFLHIVGKIEISLAITALIIVVAISSAQTILRYLFATSMWWSQEVMEIAILMTYFLGISYVFKTRQYILIELLSSKVPVRMQLIFYVIAQLLTIAFSGMIAWMFFLLMPTLLNMRTTVLGWPGWLTPLPLVTASVMLVVSSIYYFLFGMWALTRGWNKQWSASSLNEIERHVLTNEPSEDVE